jgi:hypothetical protein
MNRTSVGLLAVIAFFISACNPEPGLPDPSGKASVRAINAIPASPTINVFIEARGIGSMTYKNSTPTERYDDLDYTFNFDVLFFGESAARRVATRDIDFQAGKDYTLLVSGELASPTITLWEADERTFAEADTVFEARFAHAAASLGTVDYYFDDAAVMPTLGNQVATLAFGEVAASLDYAEGDYVLTITAAGDPDTVLYVSDSTSIGAENALIFTVFDGDASDTAPTVVRAIGVQGNSLSLPDSTYPPTLTFINASMDLGTSDIYTDEALTSRIVADHVYRDITAELPAASGSTTLFYTPADDTAAVSLETAFTATGGRRYRLIAGGVAGALGVSVLIPDRIPESTRVKLLPFQASNNFSFLDIYAVAAGETVDDNTPARLGLSTAEISAASSLTAGSYDIYVTEFLEKVVLAGPYRVDVVIGDVVELLIVDTDDPGVLDVLFLSGGPAT